MRNKIIGPILTILVVMIAEGLSSPSGFIPNSNPVFKDNANILSLAMSGDGSILVEGNSNGYMRIFLSGNTLNYQNTQTFHDAKSQLKNVGISQDGKKIIAAEINKKIWIYCLINGKYQKTQKIIEYQQIYSLKVKPDGSKFMVGLNNGIINIYQYNINSNKFQKQQKSLNVITGEYAARTINPRLLVTASAIISLDATSGFTYLIAATATNAYIYQFQSSQWVLVKVIPSTSPINSVTIANNLNIGIGTDSSLTIYNYSPSSTSLITLLTQGFTAPASNLILSPDGQTLYLGQGNSILIYTDPLEVFTLLDTFLISTDPPEVFTLLETFNIANEPITSLATTLIGDLLLFASKDKTIYQLYKCIVSNCITCSTTLRNVCIKCDVGFKLKNGKCVCVDNNSTLSQTTNLCVPCSVANCGQCNLPNVCVTCKNGFNTVLSNGVVSCVCSNLCATCQKNSSVACASCNQGFYLKNNSCLKCSVGCKTCKKVNQCVKCITGYTLIKNKCLKLRQN